MNRQGAKDPTKILVMDARAGRPNGCGRIFLEPSTTWRFGALLGHPGSTVVLVLLAMLVTSCDGRAPDQAPITAQTTATLAQADRIDEARRLADSGLATRAEVAVDALLADRVAHPTVLHLKARLLADRGDSAGAIAWCDRAIAGAPQWTDPRVLLARCYLRLDRPAAAASVYADLDRLVPQSAWGPYGQGAIALMRNDVATARRWSDLALSREPDQADVLTLGAAVARAEKDPVREAAMLERLVVRSPRDGDALVRLGDLSAAGGRDHEARRWWTLAWEQCRHPAAGRHLDGK
ncbi:hypothetical protein LBMAG53_37320 [Planctomycetota bacterium]|nr:hypothetical protein LBMAG53_37320 [Planctomycetota bacterium]